MNVTEGESPERLICGAEAYPEANFMWRFKDEVRVSYHKKTLKYFYSKIIISFFSRLSLTLSLSKYILLFLSFSLSLSLFLSLYLSLSQYLSLSLFLSFNLSSSFISSFFLAFFLLLSRGQFPLSICLHKYQYIFLSTYISICISPSIYLNIQQHG